jgi:glycosyltransferase involved in cell wall biosynthesis
MPIQEIINGVPVARPRFLSGPGYSLHSFESRLWSLSLTPKFDRLREEFRFELIHAHFSYPDGAVAAILGRRYGVPVIITEHARWRPWMDDYPTVRRIAVDAASQAAYHTAVSCFGRELIREYTGDSPRLIVTHLGVDGSVFRPLADNSQRSLDQIVYVGRLVPVKGVDTLLRAMSALVRRRPALRLLIIGGKIYGTTSKDTDRIRQLADDLHLGSKVEIAGPRPQEAVADAMRRSTLLVLPSRSETFGSVLIEALASGIPVVATRCGGPEDIVTNEVGRLVPKEDPEALATAIDLVLDSLERYPSAVLREYALARFSWQTVVMKTLSLYENALNQSPRS